MASNKQNLDKDALIYLIEQIINGDEAVSGRIDSLVSNQIIADIVSAMKISASYIKGGTLDANLIDANAITAEVLDSEQIKAQTARIDALDAEKATVTDLNAAKGRISTLETTKATITDLNAATARIGELETDHVSVSDLTAATGRIGSLETGKLDTNMLNANVGWLNQGVIKDGAISNAMINSVSANKLTAGTIDASDITVINLNADNITTGTINGQRIGNASIDLSKLSEEVPTKEYLDSVEEKLQGEIDGAIETFTTTTVPTLSNYPASNWNTNEKRATHVGDLCYVVNAASDEDGFCYRFQYNGSTYSWALIKDADVTKALKDLSDLGGEVTQFKSDYSSKVSEIDGGIESLKTRTTTVETSLGSKVDTSTFNTLKNTVDGNSASITSLTSTVNGKADDSTVTTLSNKVNTIEQTANSNKSSISSLTTTVNGKANSSDVYTKAQTDSAVKNAVDGIEVGGRNLILNSEPTGWGLTGSDYATKTIRTPGCIERATNSEGYCNAYQWLSSDTIATNHLADLSVLDGGDYVFSLDAKIEGFEYSGVDKLFVSIDWRKPGTYVVSYIAKAFLNGVNNDWQRFSTKISVPKGFGGGKILVAFVCPDETPGFLNAGDKIYYRNLKLEKGNKATDWTPAQEDIDTRITANATAIEQTDAKISSKASQTDFNALAGRVSTAESNITQTASEISSKVSKDGIISAINQSAESVSINANKINLNGAVTFSSFSSGLQTTINNKADSSAIPTKVSDLTNDSNYTTISAVEGKGYQTASDVNSAITSKGYQTSSQVESAITGKGYQTATDVSGAISTATSDMATKTYVGQQGFATETYVDDTANEIGEDIAESLTSIQEGDIADINASLGLLNRKADETDAEFENIQNSIAVNSLIALGYATIDNGVLTLGDGDSPYKVVINNQSVNLTKNDIPIAQMITDGTSGGKFKARTSELSTVKLRSDTGNGTLGFVATSNGHISLKEVR